MKFAQLRESFRFTSRQNDSCFIVYVFRTYLRIAKVFFVSENFSHIIILDQLIHIKKILLAFKRKTEIMDLLTAIRISTAVGI